MTDKDVIRAEIKRQLDKWMLYSTVEGYYKCKLCNELLSFIEETLQEEPVSEDLEEELDSYIKDNFTIDKEQLDRFGLDEKDYMYSMDKSDMLAMVRHFTELQHKKDVVIIEDLMATAFANGMADMKQRMIKYAVVGGCFVDNLWHDASEKPEREDLVIETNDGRIIHRQSINNYGMVKRWAYTSDLLNLDNSCNFGKNLQEEPVSEDLGEYISELSKQFPYVSFAKLSRIAIRVAKWQRQQDNNDANRALVEQTKTQQMCYEKGMADMKQRIMEKAVETTFNVSLPSGLYEKLWIKECKEGDKLLVIKKDEL